MKTPAGINLNPYQGLKHITKASLFLAGKASRNQPKSLSGIETNTSHQG
jgi:hypothetical protein